MNLQKKELYLHSTMCVVGGFCGAYAILCRLGNMGSAQTVNMIEIVCCLLGRNYIDFLLRLIGCVLYMTGAFLYVYLSKRTHCNVQKYSITVDILGLILLYFIPADVNPIIGLLPLFFMLSTQWCVFHGNETYNSSTIFSTNNLKQFSLALGNFFLDREPAMLAKAKFFGNSILWYHIGVAIAFFTCRAFEIHASLCCIPIALLAMVLTYL